MLLIFIRLALSNADELHLTVIEEEEISLLRRT